MVPNENFYMTVKRFCEINKVSLQAVYKKIRLHKDKELAGHIQNLPGDVIRLDDEAVDFLTPNRNRLESYRTSEENYRLALEESHRERHELEENLRLAKTENTRLKEMLAERESKIAVLESENANLKNEIERVKTEVPQDDAEPVPKKRGFMKIGK